MLTQNQISERISEASGTPLKSVQSALVPNICHTYYDFQGTRSVLNSKYLPKSFSESVCLDMRVFLVKHFPHCLNDLHFTSFCGISVIISKSWALKLCSITRTVATQLWFMVLLVKYNHPESVITSLHQKQNFIHWYGLSVPYLKCLSLQRVSNLVVFKFGNVCPDFNQWSQPDLKFLNSKCSWICNWTQVWPWRCQRP